MFRTTNIQTTSAEERAGWNMLAIDAQLHNQPVIANRFAAAAKLESMPRAQYNSLQTDYWAWDADGMATFHTPSSAEQVHA